MDYAACPKNTWVVVASIFSTLVMVIATELTSPHPCGFGMDTGKRMAAGARTNGGRLPSFWAPCPIFDGLWAWPGPAARERPPIRLRHAGPGTQFCQDGGNVMISGLAGDKQPHGNLGAGVTAAGQLKDQPAPRSGRGRRGAQLTKGGTGKTGWGGGCQCPSRSPGSSGDSRWPVSAVRWAGRPGRCR
jgi:hypothetical protein